MKNRINLSIIFTILMSMVGAKAFAYDIAVENADGVTIYYNFGSGTRLTVVSCPDTYSGIVSIPEKVNYKGKNYSVTVIDKSAFKDCCDLTSVTIPNSVTSIDVGAFSGCSGLTSVTIPTSVTYIGASAFSGCSGLTSVTIGNSVTSIGVGAFSGCSGLTSVTIPNSVTSIGDGAFRDCSGLTSVTIPNSVTNIGESAFSGCSGLTSVTISNSVTSIGGSAFSGCSGLTSVTFGNSVTSIGASAFSGCHLLGKIIIIGNSSINISSGAFNKCEQMKTIEYLADDIGEKGPLFDIFSLGIDTVVVSEKAYPYLTENSEWEKCDRIFARGADKKLYLGIRNDYNSIVGVNGVYDKNLILVPYDEDAVLQRTNTSPKEMYVMMNGESSVLTPTNPKMTVKPSFFGLQYYLCN